MTKRNDFPLELPSIHTKYCFMCGSPTVKKTIDISSSGSHVQFQCTSCQKISDRVRIWDLNMIQYFDKNNNLVHEGAGVIIQNHNKEILLFMRTKYPFLWTIPGGHMEPGEDPEKAAVREIKEEVGINIDSVNLIYEGVINNDKCMGGTDIHKWHLYHSIVSEVDIKLNDEGNKFDWFSLENIPHNITYPLAYLLSQDSVKKILIL